MKFPFLSSKKPTLEASLADVQAQLEAANAEGVSLAADLAAAVTRAETAEASLATRTTELATMTGERDGLVTAAATRATATAAALHFTPDEAAALTPENFPATAGAAIERLARRRAVELAAAQGVPPVPTAPAAGGAEDETVAAFAAADAEPDPMKRAQMFREASAKLAKGKPSGNN